MDIDNKPRDLLKASFDLDQLTARVTGALSLDDLDTELADLFETLRNPLGHPCPFVDDVMCCLPLDMPCSSIDCKYWLNKLEGDNA